MEEVLPKMKKFVFKKLKHGFKMLKLVFKMVKLVFKMLKLVTRFQKAKTALSRIFFARPWMDSAQKKACMQGIFPFE